MRPVDERLQALTPEQREAYEYLDKIRIDWKVNRLRIERKRMPAVERVFIDSNIVLYALYIDERKREVAWSLLFLRSCISLQVLNECSNELNRKRQWQVRDVAGARYSLILAAALLAGCTLLFSEDMQHEQVIEGRLTIFNPFLKSL